VVSTPEIPAGAVRETGDDRVDPLHCESGPETQWTRANADEIFPAAISPLTWSFVGDAGELGWRASFFDAGILPRSALELPADWNDRAWAIFYGRPAFNLAYLRYYAFAAFSSSDDDAGASRPPERALARLQRRAKTTWSVAWLPRRLRRLRARTDAWWRRCADPGSLTDVDRAAATLEEARDTYAEVSRLHVLNSIVPVAWAYAEVARTSARAGMGERAPALLGGFRGLEEVRLAEGLWQVTRRGRTMDDFVREFGFHGPVESELSSRSWREDPSPLVELLDALRRTPSADEPVVAERRRRTERDDAERLLHQRLPFAAGVRSRVVLAIGRRFVPLRQVGKASLLQSLDVARACARRIGTDLHGRGLLADPEDVFLLTVDEANGAVRDPSAAPLTDLVAWRRERRERYRAMAIPREFTGPPVPETAEGTGPDDDGAVVLHGQGVSGGQVEGIARVVLLATDPLDAGEILVCPFTDPGWTPLLVVAAGAVLDVGGSMSHGAIIARELGIPCVLGTGTGTRAIRDGDRIRVDGDAGVVEVLERAGTAPGTP
jgi:pyruvate,water dikinase